MILGYKNEILQNSEWFLDKYIVLCLFNTIIFIRLCVYIKCVCYIHTTVCVLVSLLLWACVFIFEESLNIYILGSGQK